MGVPARRFQPRDSLLEIRVLLLKYLIPLISLNHVQRKLLDFRQQLGLHVAQAEAVLLDFRLRRDVGKVVVRLDERVNFAQRAQAVAGLEYVIGAGGTYDYLFGADCAGDMQQVLRVCRPDAHIAWSGDGHGIDSVAVVPE